MKNADQLVPIDLEVLKQIAGGGEPVTFKITPWGAMVGRDECGRVVLYSADGRPPGRRL